MSSTTAADAPLHGRTAVVTGASRGIGREIARALSLAGAELIVVARDKDAMAQLAKELSTTRVTAYECDFAQADSVVDVLGKMRHRLQCAPDILVNNAGHFLVAPIEETEIEDFDRTLLVNLSSQFAFVRAFLPDMRARKRGHIVTIGSIADHQAFAGNAAYAASKFGARALHEVLREETRGSGIRATLISPGPVNTSLWDDINPDEREGFTPRAAMLGAAAVANAVRYAVTSPADVNVDEIRVSRA